MTKYDIYARTIVCDEAPDAPDPVIYGTEEYVACACVTDLPTIEVAAIIKKAFKTALEAAGIQWIDGDY